jgi:hypothetical protein
MHFVEETKSMISDSLFQQLKDFTKEVELEASVRKAKSGKSGMTRNVLIQNSQLTIPH